MTSKQVYTQLGPRHVAIIMDGNGRWAVRQGMSRSKGHFAGVEALHRTVAEAIKQGVKYLSVYAFSSENWQRPSEEVEALMILMAESLDTYAEELSAQGVRIFPIGDIMRLPESTRRKLLDAVSKTANNDILTLIVGLSYSARWEINHALHSAVQEIESGKVKISTLLSNANAIEPYLSTKDIPDPDLLIRTGGELRISNFLLYQLAYTELFFTETLWPDFDACDLQEALDSYALRHRRFGRIDTKDNNDLKEELDCL
ncbi:UDP pyrophosphate synthase [Porphyromonas gingivicanis]|uniref:Isoprenyl transferase n=1 Tax=Porphyromonas gingivicanis TaxID=266762 RepID=A0A0A2GAR8_9PORP|nr:polyprenyl diphosphate synthase [Porphyromonas gingivicanis]KGN97554.1 UDP pyrophosphate synthase [Porphyromonas gingivicanis]